MDRQVRRHSSGRHPAQRPVLQARSLQQILALERFCRRVVEGPGLKERAVTLRHSYDLHDLDSFVSTLVNVSQVTRGSLWAFLFVERITTADDARHDELSHDPEALSHIRLNLFQHTLRARPVLAEVRPVLRLTVVALTPVRSPRTTSLTVGLAAISNLPIRCGPPSENSNRSLWDYSVGPFVAAERSIATGSTVVTRRTPSSRCRGTRIHRTVPSPPW